MSTCLELLGWNTRIAYRGSRPSKAPFVGCLSHTAGKHEILLWWLYTQSSPFLKDACLVMAGKDNELVSKQPWKWVLSKVNLILSGDPQFSIQQIVDEVRRKKYKLLVIAPTCDREARTWKSDYYYIGVQLGWGFRVVGFDFETKRVKIGETA